MSCLAVHTATCALSPTKVKEEEEEEELGIPKLIICVDGKPKWGYANWTFQFLFRLIESFWVTEVPLIDFFEFFPSKYVHFVVIPQTQLVLL